MPPTPPGQPAHSRSTGLPTGAFPDPHHDAHSANNPPTSPSGYGPLARRIGRRTTDLLAIALVLIGGLGLGRQLIGWWSEPETPVPIAEPASWAREETPLTLEFGDSAFALQRTPVAGSRDTALARLVDACAAIAASPTAQPGPPTSPTSPTPPTPAEQRLIAAAAALEPVREDPDRWRIHVVDGPVVMAAALSQPPQPDATAADPDDGAKTSEARPQRVLCWGLAFPADENRWVLYTFRPAAERASSAVSEIPACLPHGSRQILSAVDAAGNGFTMFEGPGPLDAWQRSITACLETAGYHESTSSQLATSGWTTRFESSRAQDRPAIEIHITPSDSNTLTGLVTTHRTQRPVE